MTQAFDGPSPPTGGGAYERLTVNLTQRASLALADSGQRMDNNRTDTVNKALIVYDLLTRIQEEQGGVIFIRSVDGAELEKLRLL